jgi:hypothetical protein
MTVEAHEPGRVMSAELLNQLDIWAQALALSKSVLSVLSSPR